MTRRPGSRATVDPQRESSGPPSVERIDFLDFGKGVAILGIVLYHYSVGFAGGFAGKAILVAGSGVHLFMLLSGFGLSLSRYSGEVRRFYGRRFTRILIPYYLFVTFVLVVNAWHPYYLRDGLYAYFGHIFWYKMFDGSIFGSFGPHLWFMSPLLVLYVLFPLLRAIQDRLGGGLFLALACAVSVSWWLIVAGTGHASQAVWARFALSYVWEFGLGMFLGRMYLERKYAFWDQNVGALAVVIVAGFGSVALLAEAAGPVGRMVNDVPSLAAYTALVILAYLIARRWWPRVISVMGALGVVSLEVYLVHLLVDQIVAEATGSSTGTIDRPVLLLPVLGGAILAGMLLKTVTRPLVTRVSGLPLPIAEDESQG
jgi:peptidoglycan/LPS O-acetylase OafA/YrhL